MTVALAVDIVHRPPGWKSCFNYAACIYQSALTINRARNSTSRDQNLLLASIVNINLIFHPLKLFIPLLPTDYSCAAMRSVLLSPQKDVYTDDKKK